MGVVVHPGGVASAFRLRRVLGELFFRFVVSPLCYVDADDALKGKRYGALEILLFLSLKFPLSSSLSFAFSLDVPLFFIAAKRMLSKRIERAKQHRVEAQCEFIPQE